MNPAECDNRSMAANASVRSYSPSLGRFIQPDTVIPDLGNSQAWNRYSYVNNSPIMYVDPSGHTPIVDDCEFFGECADTGSNGYEPINPWVVTEEDNISDLKKTDRKRKQAEGFFLREFNLPLHPDDLKDVDTDNYSAFGGCNTYTGNCGQMHASVDSQIPSNYKGRPIYSVAYGTIVFEGAIAGFGNYIVVEHDVYGEKFYSVYAHLQVNNLQPVGTVVDNHIQIGEMGDINQANGTHQGPMGVHLHFEVRKATNVNSSYGVGGKVWWPTSLNQMHETFVGLSSIFGKGQAFGTLP